MQKKVSIIGICCYLGRKGFITFSQQKPNELLRPEKGQGSIKGRAVSFECLVFFSSSLLFKKSIFINLYF